MKQPWFCEACGASGTCTISLGSGVFTGLAAVKKAHRNKSITCDFLNGDSKVRIRNPALCTRNQWRDLVKRSNSLRASGEIRQRD